ncbi:hypothetical protein LOTGIDRAFT_171167 [Lottia gigantea]|uniref:CUB domain-containing protein n=1 Tax=Lottia gigantea TaxID=225164 RepID=V4B0N7_LOTGI|nr:hypothetical protein LOTGIDRAFT_171167 [Lottia gigantea]ESP03738.1 hypothetical protein LOTGIDRAFT_171167 [Lottia gigantea]
MAISHDWSFTLLWLIWIFTLLFSDSYGKRTQNYYMEGLDCGDSKHIGGATVYSNFRGDVSTVYGNDIECQMTFKAENKDWRLMLRIIELDIPDRTSTGLCNDALYVYDESSIYARAMEEANGNTGLCGNILPPTLYSTGQYLTVHFSVSLQNQKDIV